MPEHLPVHIGSDAVARLVNYCVQQAKQPGPEGFALVADHNTYQVLGRAVESALRDANLDVLTTILEGDDIGADATSVYQVLMALDGRPRTFISVGSGTVTDVARFVSHRSGAQFISAPTAASVDGYTSIGAPMIFDGAKVTVTCHGPLAVFADLPTLCAAPRLLTASGFGDLLAKLTSVADWEIGHVLWDEPYDAAIAARARKAVWRCVEKLDAVSAAECDGIQALFDGLIESGFCMLDFGETRPASGYEHHVAHFWEMKLLREGRHSIFHGAKVGLAVLASTQVYERLRSLSASDVAIRVKEVAQPDQGEEAAVIRAAFGPQAGQVISIHEPFLQMDPDQFKALQERIIAKWDEIHPILERVPAEAEMREWLERVGGPTTPESLGLSQEEYEQGLRVGHYYRARFTGKKLAYYLGLE